MRYFFILGTNPTLSLAELAAIFNNAGKLSLIQTNIAILETNQEIAVDIIKKIGGTIKFGLIHDKINSHSTGDILNAITNFAKPDSSEKKFMFGISNYGKNKTNIKALAMEFKKLLKQSGINSRWVISREPTLSSVVVEQNDLTTNKGAEIVIIQFNNKLLLGKTLAVQPFKELSFRDYGRPARDDRSGMLPPKLAQIMINLALPPSPDQEDPPDRCQARGRGEVILDPFCGSGTILTEAMLMGYQNMVGADISSKAILDAKTNIIWMQKNYDLPIINYKLYETDAAQIAKHLAPNSVDAIITEPYLGPPRGWLNINTIIKELEQLYSRSLSEFNKILKPGGRIVMVWPVFCRASLSLRGSASDRSNLTNTGLGLTVNPDLAGLKIINPIPENLRTNIFIKLTNRQTIIYGREQQKVWREIVVLKNSSPIKTSSA